MLSRSRPLMLSASYAATAADPDTLYVPRVPEGEVWHVTRYTWEALTDIMDAARSLVRIGSTVYPVREWIAPVNAVLYHDDVDLWLVPGSQLALRLTTIDSGDRFDLHAYGLVYSMDPDRALDGQA